MPPSMHAMDSGAIGLPDLLRWPCTHMALGDAQARLGLKRCQPGWTAERDLRHMPLGRPKKRIAVLRCS